MDLTMLGFWITTHLSFLNRWADKWNVKVRIPIARFIARNIILGTYSNVLIDSLTTIIGLSIIFATFTVYSLPIVILTQNGGDTDFTIGLLTFGIIYLIFEEETRLLRKVCQAIDERKGFKPYGQGTLYKWPTHNKNKVTNKIKIITVITLGVLAAFSMQLGALYDAANVPNTSENVKLMAQVALHHPIILLTITWLLAPVIEEIVFRGIFFRVFLLSDVDKEQSKNRTIFFTLLASAIQAVIFSIAHSPNTLGYAISIFITGVLMSTIVLITGRVKYAAYAHILVNVGGVFISMFLSNIFT